MASNEWLSTKRSFRDSGKVLGELISILRGRDEELVTLQEDGATGDSEAVQEVNRSTYVAIWEVIGNAATTTKVYAKTEASPKLDAHSDGPGDGNRWRTGEC